MGFNLYPGWPHHPRQKQCSRCDSWLPQECFAIDRTRKDGKQSACSVCRLTIKRIWVRKNTAALTDSYVKNVISSYTKIPYHLIPPALIEAKRLQLQLLRSTR